MDEIAFHDAMAAYDLEDLATALELMERSATSGHPRACYFLALWHRSGELGVANREESDRWRERLKGLAENGDPYAQWELAQSLRFGDLFQADIAQANRWLERAAENGWPEAQHHLAWFIEGGQYGYAQDPIAAEHWYRRALDQGHPETIFAFAMREFEGTRPTEKAIALLQRAAAKGFSPAVEALRRYRQ